MRLFPPPGSQGDDEEVDEFSTNSSAIKNPQLLF